MLNPDMGALNMSQEGIFYPRLGSMAVGGISIHSERLLTVCFKRLASVFYASHFQSTPRCHYYSRIRRRRRVVGHPLPTV